MEQQGLGSHNRDYSLLGSRRVITAPIVWLIIGEDLLSPIDTKPENQIPKSFFHCISTKAVVFPRALHALCLAVAREQGCQKSRLLLVFWGIHRFRDMLQMAAQLVAIDHHVRTPQDSRD